MSLRKLILIINTVKICLLTSKKKKKTLKIQRLELFEHFQIHVYHEHLIHY